MITFRFCPDDARHNEFWSEFDEHLRQANIPAHTEPCTYQHGNDVELEVLPEQTDVLVDMCAARGWSCQRSDVMDWDGPQWLGSANNWGRVNA